MKHVARITVVSLTLFCVIGMTSFAQEDRREVRAGNRKFRSGQFAESEIFYRKAALKDSTSVAAQYNLASSLYRQEDYEGASKALDSVKEEARGASFHYNAGDVALQRKDYGAALEAFRKSLMENPSDLDAKENYIYAKMMLEKEQNSGGSDNNQNQNQDQNENRDQDQNQDQNRNQDQNQDQEQNQNENEDRDQSQDRQQGQISQQQARQMLNAIQAKEKETQDKVNKEKAALLQSRQKEKNW